MVAELYFERDLFGEKLRVRLYDVEESVAQEILEEMYHEALRLQKIFNFYDPASELSILNSRRSAQLSPELEEVLTSALLVCKETRGAYDISLGKSFMQRKYGNPITPLACSYTDIHIENHIATLKHPDVFIDLGSIAKGYIADTLAQFLQSYGIENGMIDARGDIIFFGSREHLIEVQHPRITEQAYCTIRVVNKAVATSGDYRQFHKTYNNSHILNQQDAASITVIAPTLMQADAYATALFVIDASQRKELLSRNEQIAALVIDTTLASQEYNGFNALVHYDS